METLSLDGLDITLAKMALSQSQKWDSSMLPGVWCGILVEGTIATSRHGFDNTWSPRTAINYCVEEPVQVEHRAPLSCHLSAVFVRIPMERVEAIAGHEGVEALTPQDEYFRAWRNQRTACALAWQMLGCPLTGPARRFYLSGKALEILSAIAEIGSSEASAAKGVVPARASEIERVHAARAMLLAALNDPPSVPALARSVGMNAHRMSELFKTVFGASVYAFVKAARLDHARLLLESGEVTVSQAAYTCGYHPAHFSTEFRKRFGMPPSAVLGRTHPDADGRP